MIDRDMPTEPQLRAAAQASPPNTQTELERYARAAYERYARCLGEDPEPWFALSEFSRLRWEAVVRAVFIEHARDLRTAGLR